jgi:hypothetical protein
MVTQTRASFNNQQNTAINTNNNNMSFNTIKAETFIFPHTKLTPIAGEPTHATIAKLKSELYANARQNLTTLGGGNLGYLGIILTDAEYTTLQTKFGFNLEPFIIPATPAALTAAATDIEKINYQEALQHRVNCNTMEALLQQQIITAIDAKYIKKVKDEDFGFACIKCGVILRHIITTYDKITPEDMLVNADTLAAPFDCNNPIADLWERIDICKQFAKDGGAPIHDIMIMVIILKVIKDTGQFTTYVAHWNRTKDATKTMDDFVEYFTDCDTERKLQTAKDAGYHSANSVNNNNKTTAPSTTIISANGDTSFLMCNERKVYYCHTHGGTLNPAHTSATCSNPGPKHIRNATWTNHCNGCTVINIGPTKPARNRNNNGNSNNNNNNGNGNGTNNNNNNGNNNNNNRNTGNNNNNSNNNNNGNSNNNNGNNNNNSNNNNNGNNNNNNSNNNNNKSYSAAVTSPNN